jgi:hypothetical protein
LFCRFNRRPARAPVDAPALEMDNRLSVPPDLPRRGKDLPGYGAILFVRAVVQHSAGLALASPLLLFEKIHGEVAIAFTENRTLGIRKDHSFRGHVPTVHTLACLRFADLVTETVARFATGSGGLTPGRAGFAPAGRHVEISWSHRNPSNPNRPAEPGRTVLPIASMSVPGAQLSPPRLDDLPSHHPGDADDPLGRVHRGVWARGRPRARRVLAPSSYVDLT